MGLLGQQHGIERFNSSVALSDGVHWEGTIEQFRKYHEINLGWKGEERKTRFDTKDGGFVKISILLEDPNMFLEGKIALSYPTRWKNLNSRATSVWSVSRNWEIEPRNILYPEHIAAVIKSNMLNGVDYKDTLNSKLELSLPLINYGIKTLWFSPIQLKIFGSVNYTTFDKAGVEIGFNEYSRFSAAAPLRTPQGHLDGIWGLCDLSRDSLKKGDMFIGSITCR